MKRTIATILASSVVLFVSQTHAQNPPGEEPSLAGSRVTQTDITNGSMTLDEIRAAGLRIFATPFN
ncbi:MAG: hypothetical protein OEQ74_07390, partial [Gammaproteobacteria bacterium]|nr:hypothetical protein [Gammaproteobacteria bacterium]